MTVHKAIKQEAERAAELAYALLRGEEPEAGLVSDQVDNGHGEIPSVLLEPVAVTEDNVDETVVADGFQSVEEICTRRYVDACGKAGIG